MKQYNFKIDSDKKSVSIEVSSAIFPVPVILLAVYHFIDEAKVIVKPGKKDNMLVTLIPEKETNLEELAYEFNIQLISSFLEDEESRKHVGVRETLMKAALLPQAQISPQKEPAPEKPSPL